MKIWIMSTVMNQDLLQFARISQQEEEFCDSRKNYWPSLGKKSLQKMFSTNMSVWAQHFREEDACISCSAIAFLLISFNLHDLIRVQPDLTPSRTKSFLAPRNSRQNTKMMLG